MNTIDYKKIIRRYAEAGIRLWADGDKLRFSVPKNDNGTGGMDEEKLNFLKSHKDEIIEELKKEEKRFLLTDIQSAYLLGRLDSFDYGGVSCQIYLEIDYEQMDAKRCEWAWNQLIRRHEMLRAIICEDGYQIIQQETPQFFVENHDLLNQGELQEIRDRMSNNSFDIGGWPYFAVALSKQGQKKVMHVSFDFLIADWNSIWILLKEFENLYFGKELPATPELTFQKYLEMENELLSTSDGLRDKEYWKKRIPDLPMRPMLPILDNRMMESGFDRLIYEMPKDQWEKFSERAKENGCTTTAAVMTAYALCLATWSETKHFCLNLTLLNRMPIHPQVYDIVGDFTSVNLLEIRLNSNEKFRDLMKRIQAQMMEDLDHRLYSGVKTMREYAAVHGKEESIFPYVFTGSIGLVGTGKFTGTISGYGKSSTPQVFIDCQAMDGPDGLRINWDVRKGVFDPVMLQDMFEAYGRILQRLACEEEVWQQAYPLMIPERQITIRDKVNNTYKNYEKATLFGMVWKAMQKYPDRVALIDKNESVTYGELQNRVLRVAHSLMQQGAVHGEKIGILMSKHANQATAVLGVLAIGCVYVPMDLEQPVQRLKGIIQKAKIKICICEKEIIRLQEENCACFDIDTLLKVNESRAGEYTSDSKENDLAYIIFTSGSTGIPKGVQITNKAAVNTILAINEQFGVTHEDKVLALSKLNFDLSVYDLFGMLGAGGTVVYPDEENYLVPSEWTRCLETYGITIWNTVPAFMSMLMDYCETTDKKVPLRLVLMSGDWIATTLPDQIRKHTQNVQVISLGGATEAAIWSNYYICQEKEVYIESIPYGYPLPNQGFFIADEFGNPVPDHVPGELCIYGEELAEGYLDDPEQNALHFVYNDYLKKRVYKTGDFGYYREDGVIIFLGRRDAQVKIRGHRIELGEIEKTLLKNDAVEEACAVVIERSNKTKEILAVVTPKSVETKENINIEEVLAHNTEELVMGQWHETEWEMKRDKTALSAILFALQKFGVLLPNKTYTAEEIKCAKGIATENAWLIPYDLLALERNGLLKKEGEYISTHCLVTEEDLQQSIQEMLAACEEKQHVFGEYLAQAFEKYYEILAGEVNPIHLLYPQGSDRVLESLYAENPIANVFNDQVAKLIAILSEGKETYRILEIGGGSAATSRRVLKELRDKNRNVQYYFTDVAESFMAKARQHLSEYTNVVFQVFDMDVDFREQGFVPLSFDAVIATGVIENAKNVKETLGRIEELIAPGGYLFATEPTREENWILAAQAVMMTPPEDELRKERLYLTEDLWRAVIDQTVEGELHEFPSKGGNYGNLKLWVKQMNAGLAVPKVDELNKLLGEYLPEYMLPGQIQVLKKLPLTANGKVDRKRIQTWHVEQKVQTQEHDIESEMTDPVTKEVMEVIAGALGLPSIQSDKDLYEYGVDSLVQAQIAGKLKQFADEKIAKDALSFDQILRVMLNGTTAGELAKFMQNNRNVQQVSDESMQEDKQREETEDDLGELTWLKEGDGTLLVLLPPALGTLSGIADLAEAVKEKAEQPVCALTIKNAMKYCEIDVDDVINTVADSYTTLLTRTKHSKIRLVGYCMGGFLALEIARRLSDLGDEVDKLIMIDSTPVMDAIEDEIVIELIFLNSFYMAPGEIFTSVQDSQLISAITQMYESNGHKINKDSYLNLKEQEKYRSVYELFQNLKEQTQDERFRIYADKIAKKGALEETLQMIKDQYEVYMHSFRASKLDLEAYFGDLLFLKASEDQPYVFLDREAAIEFWKETCIGEVEVLSVEGNHDSCIEGQNARDITELILK